MTPRRHYAMWMAALVGTLSCQSRATKSNAPAALPDLAPSLEVALQSDHIRLGNFVIADIRLTNKSARPLWVNGRLMMNRADDPPPVRNLWMLVLGPDQHAVSFECMRQTRPATAADYRTLNPGETISEEEILSTCYRFDRTGHYRLAAFYQDQNPERPPLPATAVGLSSLLQSEAVGVDVVP
jgi:hypothetical protein